MVPPLPASGALPGLEALIPEEWPTQKVKLRAFVDTLVGAIIATSGKVVDLR